MNRRRIALTVLAAATLAVAPTAAMAYDAPSFNTSTTDATPTVGETFTITTNGTTAGEAYTLTITSNPASISNDAITIAGTKSLTKTATGTSVSFSVTLTAAGTYTAQVFDAAGNLVGDEVLTVTAAGAAAGALPATGFDGVELAAGAGALVLAGAGAVLVARRRQTAQAR
ncbi:LPXTG cell wall anchor domain-containing protein [Actinotalea sp. JY-7885]|uniref:LPXTG cell wall anchor domain-containing protein n=1 Tax=Actinotalea sp. JY-7885 TaxID=2758576 RepID=UPI00165EB220|nr:LPXTG cell wall anchor domain-containing protein [Actinotalea sp. JY-7885]